MAEAREPSGALAKSPGWKEFREWVRSSVELEARRVIDDLEHPRLDKQQGRRDAFEDVWGMVLAFEKEGEDG